MHRNFKRLVSILIVAVLVFGSVPLAGFMGLELPELNLFNTKAEAATSGTCGENLTWTFEQSTGELVISGTGTMINWSNSSNVSWYSYRLSIKSVVIEDGVTSIGDYAFNLCAGLTSVTIPDSITSIGDYAFNWCVGLTSTIIPDGVTSIGDYAFAYSGVETVTLGNGVTSIGSYAFEECDNLAIIIIPDGVTSIGDHAFSWCESLVCATIPNSVTSIGNYAFSVCYSLTDVYYSGTKVQWNEISIDSNNECLTDATIHYEHIHSASIITENVASTCIEKGYKICMCICGYTFTQETTALGHDIIIDKAVDATCTETGLTEGQHCSRCDNVTVEQEVVPALNHKGTLVQVEAQAPTCTETGWDAYEYCTACDYTTYVEKESLNHDIVIDKAVSSTCTATGLTEGQHCSRCNDVTVEQEITPKLKHEMVVDAAVSPTCTQTGLTAGCHCKNCDEATVEQEIVPALGHTESDAVTENSTEAKCGQAGSYDSVVYCPACGEETSRERVTVDALKHQYNEVVIAPTCTEGGYTIYTCSLCGDTYIDDEIGSLGHDIVIDAAVNATCTSTGLTKGQHCSRCDGATISQEVISVKSHEYTVKYDSSKHWEECVCGAKINTHNHTFGSNSLCDCGYKRVVNATIAIKNNNGSKTINYGETLKLTAVTNSKPYDAKIYWYVDGVLMGEGEVFNVNFESGAKVITVKLVDSNGYALQNADGNEISDSENVIVKSGFFQKLISFFKNLFGIGRTVVQSIRF